jgi:pre-rRNA-processing protein TSR1
VDLAKAAEVLLLLLPGGGGTAAVDEAGSSNLAILRAMGLPTTLAVVVSGQQQQQQNGTAAAADEDMMLHEGGGVGSAAAAGGPTKGSTASQKQRSAAKKHAEKALQQHLAGEIKLMAADTQADMQQVLRVLADSTPQLPVWRRQRPYLLVQQAAFVPQQQQQQQEDGVGELRVTGYIRTQGLSANQLISLPGAGDFRIARIEGLQEPVAAAVAAAQQQRSKAAAASGEVDMVDAAGGDAAAGGVGRVLAVPDAQQQEALVREAEADPLAGECLEGTGPHICVGGQLARAAHWHPSTPTSPPLTHSHIRCAVSPAPRPPCSCVLTGEQTWPTEEELSAAAAAAAGGQRLRKRRLPAGTSEYQAAWILDDDDDDDEQEGSDSENEQAAWGEFGGCVWVRQPAGKPMPAALWYSP